MGISLNMSERKAAAAAANHNLTDLDGLLNE